jgi:hypothetical protein
MTAAKFRAKFSTAGRIAPVEEWLKLNIKGRWSIQMDSVSDDMSKKNYLILFDNEADRDSFKLRFIYGQAAFDKKTTAVESGPGLFSKISKFFGTPKAKSKPKSNPKARSK